MTQYEFYRSKNWHSCSNGYRNSVHNICERCGRYCWRKNDKRYVELKKNGEEVYHGIVHHIEHLNSININDPYISLNWSNLELLCILCHNKEHMKKDLEVREDIKFDSEGRLVLNVKKKNIYDGK